MGDVQNRVVRRYAGTPQYDVIVDFLPRGAAPIVYKNGFLGEGSM